MERAICQVKTAHRFPSPPPPPPSSSSILLTPKIGVFCPSNVSLRPVQHQQTFTTLRLSCAKGSSSSSSSSSSVPEVDKILMEISNIEQPEELVGVVELLECLEKEAIMGDDNGTDPTDYNRRALIFDKSSKVFQALKNTTTTSSAV